MSDEAETEYHDLLTRFESLVYETQADQDVVQDALTQYVNHTMANQGKKVPISELLLGINAIFDTNRIDQTKPLA